LSARHATNTNVASNHFRTRGLAPLRMDKDGSIILDPALALKPKTLRVRVSENGKIMGTSHLPIDTETTDMVIEKSIQLARDSLFEEELYHEISLETRQLSKYGVEFRDSVIQVNAPDTSTRQRQRKLLIDCIPRNEHIASGQDTSYDWLAQNVAEGLRLLLAHEHSMRLHRRSQLPSPLNAKKKERQQPPLLRTLLAVLKHLDGVDSLYGYLEATTKSLSSAGITIGLETTREISWAKLADDLRSSTNTDLSATDRLLDIFLKPFDGKATLTLPSLNGAQAESLVVTTRTIVGAPTYGTEHKVTFPASLTADLGLFQQSKHSTVKEVQSHLDMILSLHLAHRQLKSNFAPKTVIKDREANITILSKESIKGPKGDRDIEVLLKEGQLTVIATPTDSKKATEDEQDLYVWDGNTGHASLEEKIASWVG
jgi:mediator of RNA polymerase II transcription subunit 17